MSTNKGKRKVAIVGSVVSGRSCHGYWTGSMSVLQDIGSSGDIEVYVNSPGGSVFAGFEILNALNAASVAGRKIDIYVSSMAASIASYITSGVRGAKVHMAENAKLMFHAPWTIVMGSKDQLRDTADLLAQMEDDIVRAIDSRGAKADRQWFAAGRAKWISAKEAVELKLADDVQYPPAELISHIASQSLDSGFYDKENPDAKAMKAEDRFAATSSFEGYLGTLCEDRFGEKMTIGDVSPTHFRATKEDGSAALLKYRGDSLNIVDIEWDSAVFESNREQEMSAKLTADAEAKAKEEADAKAKADAEAKAKEEADAKAKADAEAKRIAGMTPDMIAFATKNYKAARDGHVASIKACKANSFSDAELDAFSIETLAKIVALVAKPDDKSTVDNSLIAPAPAAKGTGGTLPPPEN